MSKPSKQPSRASEVLKGKVYPGTDSKVKSIAKQGNVRIVTLRDDTIVRTTKKAMLKAFETVMKQTAKHTALEQATHHRDGRVTVMIGGQKEGTPKTYKSEGAAKAALTRRYGQDQ